VDQELRTLASTTTAVNAPPSVVDHLVEHGKSIMHDVACQLARNQMGPAEHAQVNTLTHQGYQVTGAREVPGL
jgi:hypothetical protein